MLPFDHILAIEEKFRINGCKVYEVKQEIRKDKKKRKVKTTFCGSKTFLYYVQDLDKMLL